MKLGLACIVRITDKYDKGEADPYLSNSQSTSITDNFKDASAVSGVPQMTSRD
jgi:hypothetical protein